MNLKHTFEISLKILNVKIGSVESLRYVLLKHGILENQIVEYEHYPYISLKIYYANKKDAFRTLKSLKAIKLKSVKINIKQLTPKMWMKKGEETFKTFRLTPKIFVVPDKGKKKFSANGNKIVLMSGLAFGTGLHETTRFMSGIVEKYARPRMCFIDIGTGTGILTMVALKNGVSNSIAIDISKDAVQTAKANFVINGYGSARVKKEDFNDFSAQRRYDFVAANLITKDLIFFQKKLKALVAPGGLLAVSGISLENYDFFKEHFKYNGFKCVRIVKGKEWVAVLLRKQ